MNATTTRRPFTQADADSIAYALRTEFPNVTVRLRSRFLLRLRIIDERFRDIDVLDRQELVDPYLEQLSEELQEGIFFVLLLTPEEVATSPQNHDFENPRPWPID